MGVLTWTASRSGSRSNASKSVKRPLYAELISNLVQAFPRTLTDAPHLSVGMALIDGDELGSEPEPYDSNLQGLSHSQRIRGGDSFFVVRSRYGAFCSQPARSNLLDRPQKRTTLTLPAKPAARSCANRP